MVQEIYNKLKEYDIYPEIYEGNDGVIVICVEWGDWKHEHALLDHIMAEMDFMLIDTKITNSDGSDCYSADHYYKKAHF